MSAANNAIRLALIGAAAIASACTHAPTQTETAVMTEAQARPVLPASRAERDAAETQSLLVQATFWGREYEKNPTDYETALKFARVLRAMNSSQQASEVANQALTLKPGDVDLTLIFAQASLDMGQPSLAITPLARAEANAVNDWRLMSIIGVVLDQMGKYSDAQAYYTKALQLSPDNAKVMSNLGLSYALANQPARAEEVLRRAAALPDADSRIRQNLVLVLGVQGKFDEAAKAAGPDAPTGMVEANQEYFRTLLTPARRWEGLRGQQN